MFWKKKDLEYIITIKYNFLHKLKSVFKDENNSINFKNGFPKDKAKNIN